MSNAAQLLLVLALEYRMISKHQRIIVGVVFTLLLLLSLAGVIYAFASSGLMPMIISDSAPELSSKVSDEERARILEIARIATFRLSYAILFLTACWATFANCIILLWSRSSRNQSNKTPLV